MMVLAFASYSKYSTKKKKQSTRAKVSIDKKKADTSSKHNTSSTFVKKLTTGDPQLKKYIPSIACKYLYNPRAVSNSNNRPNKHTSATISSSIQRP